MDTAYQLSFCVSGAILISTPSFSEIGLSALKRGREYDFTRTKVLNLEDTSDGTAGSPVLDLAVCWRCWSFVIDGGVDLAEGRLFCYFCGHCGCCLVGVKGELRLCFHSVRSVEDGLLVV